jgi:hypothetical protein
MRDDRRSLLALTRLAAVVEVKRAAAEAELLRAQAGQRIARASHEEALARVETAESDWLDHVSRPALSPELCGALAASFIAKEKEASQAGQRSARAAELTDGRRSEWQASDARSRSGKSRLRSLGRKVRHRLEEASLAETADLITFRWSLR